MKLRRFLDLGVGVVLLATSGCRVLELELKMKEGNIDPKVNPGYLIDDVTNHIVFETDTQVVTRKAP